MAAETRSFRQRACFSVWLDIFIYNSGMSFRLNIISLLINLQQCHWNGVAIVNTPRQHNTSSAKRWLHVTSVVLLLAVLSIWVFSPLNSYSGSYFIKTNNCLFWCKWSIMTDELFNHFNRCRKPLPVAFSIKGGCFSSSNQIEIVLWSY